MVYLERDNISSASQSYIMFWKSWQEEAAWQSLMYSHCLKCQFTSNLMEKQFWFWFIKEAGIRVAQHQRCMCTYLCVYWQVRQSHLHESDTAPRISPNNLCWWLKWSIGPARLWWLLPREQLRKWQKSPPSVLALLSVWGFQAFLTLPWGKTV